MSTQSNYGNIKVNYELLRILGNDANIGGYTFSFPIDSGTFSLLSDLNSYLPLSGGTMSGDIETSSSIFSPNGGYIDFSESSAVGITNDNNGYTKEGFYISPGYASLFIDGYNSELGISSGLGESLYYYDSSITFAVGSNLSGVFNSDFLLGLGGLSNASKSSNFIISTSNGSVNGSASNSGLIGGYLNSIGSQALRSVVVGGNNISATNPDTLYTKNIEVKGNAIIDGSLTISGTQTFINTENLYVEDNIITLNATYSGPATVDAGIEVNLGDGTYSKVLWDAGIGYWQVGLSGSESTIITQNGSGLLKSNNELSVDFGTVSSISYVDTSLNNYLPLSGGTMSGNIKMDNGIKIETSNTEGYVQFGNYPYYHSVMGSGLTQSSIYQDLDFIQLSASTNGFSNNSLCPNIQIFGERDIPKTLSSGDFNMVSAVGITVSYQPDSAKRIAMFLNTGGVTQSPGVRNSVVIGADGATVKSDNSVYVNQIAIVNKSSAIYEGILNSSALSNDVTWTLPVNGGTISLISDLDTTPYLPLSGGTMSGTIQFENNGEIYGQSGYMFVKTPALGIGSTDHSPTELVHISGGNAIIEDGQIAGGINTTALTPGTTASIDWNAGNFQTIDFESSTGNIILELSNPIAGAAYTLKIIQGPTARTITYPSSMKWEGGTPLTPSTTDNAEDIITMIYDGTNYYASYGTNFS